MNTSEDRGCNNEASSFGLLFESQPDGKVLRTVRIDIAVDDINAALLTHNPFPVLLHAPLIIKIH